MESRAVESLNSLFGGYHLNNQPGLINPWVTKRSDLYHAGDVPVVVYINIDMSG